VDKAMEKFGLAMGPFRMGDLAGNDIGWAIRKRRYVEKPDVTLFEDRRPLCELGRFGQKTGMGWYRYEAGKRDAGARPRGRQADRGLPQGAASRARKIERRGDRRALHLRAGQRGARILEEGIAQRASDIDIVYLNGYGFPLHRGGPMFYADRSASTTSCAPLQRFAAEPGDGVVAARAAARQARRRRRQLQLNPTPRRHRHDRRRHRLHRPHRPRQELARRLQHDPRRHARRPCRQHAVARAGIDPAEVEDVHHGLRHPEGATGGNIARQIALRAGLPVTVGGVTVNRFCSSGLQTIAMAAQRVIVEGAPVIVAGGVESISCVQNESNQPHAAGPLAGGAQAGAVLAMLQTAETVAKRYGITRELQDEYGARSQQRAFAAQEAGKFNDEIVPITRMGVVDKASGRITTQEVTISADEGIRADTTLEGVQKIRRCSPAAASAAGNASQFSDGAAACVVMMRSSPRSAASSRSASSAASPSPAASPTRWASARCSRCRACCSAPG
jgi:acetyl-CoA acetyltransferase family protein